jgi:N-acetylglucosaminyldiphosphoundecaprenol N-acetyl-beta-D-mannosaminyltransferase
MIDRGKRNVLGVAVDAVDYEAAVERLVAAAKRPERYAATALAVHGVITAVLDDELRARINRLDLVTPDGQPVRWALNLIHRAELAAQVRGTDLTLRVLARCERERLRVLFYGSDRRTLDLLSASVAERFPDLDVAACLPSRFERVRRPSLDGVAAEIARHAPNLVFVGLGCPRQEIFVHELRELVDAPLLAVGAAFDYIAGTLREPPPAVRRRGLEWLWRLALEPRRLWRRYVLLNPAYLALLTLQAAHVWRPTTETRSPSELDEIAV